VGAWRDRLRNTAYLTTGDSEAAPTRRLGRLWLVTALMLAVIFDAWLVTIMPHWAPGTDLYAAWRVDLADPWSGASGSMVGAGVFRYSPVIAQFASLFAGLPWVAAQLGFLAVQLVVIVLMAGRRWPYVVLFPGVFWNLYFGNVDLLMGAAIVAGFRYPGAWAFLFLTKITPGIGVLWFAFRREWRKVGIALGTTALIFAVSFVLAPGLWSKWADALLEMSSLPQSAFYPPLAIRLAIALLLVWFAARSDRAWLLPVACLVAVPNPWFVTFAILGASVVLSGPGRRQASPGPPNLVA
jgi:Glycosyltransferase family 87